MTSSVLSSVDPAEVYDLIGIGLGPTHVALAVAFKEDHPDGRALFLDQRPAFAWHPALLLPASRMQISFLKDLATFRNPQSTFSFVSYLHACGRLVAFTNLGVWTPSRLEWASYLAWAAERLQNDGYVEWDARVEAIEPVHSAASDGDAGTVGLFKVIRRDPRTNTVRTSYARNVSVAPGSTPYIPAPFASLTTPRIAHTATYLTTLANPALARQLNSTTFSGRIAVIGGGQSSAEVFNDLMGRLPNAKVDMIYRASALVPADDSPFVNARAFDPAMTDEFWSMREGERQERLREFKRANYACIAPELIESMYKLTYTQSVRGGTPQYRLLSNTEVTSIELVPAASSSDLDLSGSSEDNTSVRLTLGPTLSTGPAPNVETYDLVFLGTGYHRPAASLAFLSGTKDAFPELGNFLSGQSPILQVDRDYAVAPAVGAEDSAKLFVLGFAEKTHGLSETLLSVGAVRAGEVVRALASPLLQQKEAQAVVVAGAKTAGELTKVPMLDVPRGRPVQHTGTLTPESDSSPERKSFT